MRSNRWWLLGVVAMVTGCTVNAGGGDDGGGGTGSRRSGLERKADEARGLTEDTAWKLGVESPRVAVVEGAGIAATAHGIVIGEELVEEHSRECLAEILLMTAGATYDQRTGFVDYVLDAMLETGSLTTETYDVLIVSEMRVAVVWGALGAWELDSDPASPEIADWLSEFEGGESDEWAEMMDDLVIGLDDVADDGWLEGDAWFMEDEGEIGWDDGWDESDAEDFDEEWGDDWGDDWDDEDADWDEEADWEDDWADDDGDDDDGDDVDDVDDGDDDFDDDDYDDDDYDDDDYDDDDFDDDDGYDDGDDGDDYDDYEDGDDGYDGDDGGDDGGDDDDGDDYYDE